MGLEGRMIAAALTLAMSGAAQATEFALPPECARYADRGSNGRIHAEALPLSVLAHYRQNAYAPVDPVGDYALAWHAKVTAMKIAWMAFSSKELAHLPGIGQQEDCALALFKLPREEDPLYDGHLRPWTAPKAELEIIDALEAPIEVKRELLDLERRGKLYLEGHRNPIKVANLVATLTEVVSEERANGIEPVAGKQHDWDPEFKARYQSRFYSAVNVSKLLVALSRGETYRYMMTGTEKDLQEWLLGRPVRGVTLHELFRASYRLNRGDVHLTLLTIENVLARHWRHPNREKLALTGRLRPIINHFGKRADHFGSWYHFFGIMLYGYVAGEKNADFIGAMETRGSHVLSGEDETQEDFINAMGGKVGARLREVISKKTYLEHRLNVGYLRQSYYLDLNEDFSARLLKYPLPRR